MTLTDILASWVDKIESENPPPANITALYFGLMSTDKGYMVFLTGAEEYDPNDDDWAGETDYQPPRAGKYVLIDRALTKGLKWKGVLDNVAAALRELAKERPDRPLFTGRVAATGFDDGALQMIKEA